MMLIQLHVLAWGHSNGVVLDCIMFRGISNILPPLMYVNKEYTVFQYNTPPLTMTTIINIKHIYKLNLHIFDNINKNWTLWAS